MCTRACLPQGMNFLAGLLLLAVEHDCYRTFWLLVVLLEKVGKTAMACTAAADA